jgi:hypothetical protein
MTERAEKADIRDLDGARAFLERVANSEDKRPLNLTERLEALHPQIAVLRTKGYTWDQIAGMIDGASKDTIRHAYGKASAEKKRQKKKDQPVARGPKTGVSVNEPVPQAKRDKAKQRSTTSGDFVPEANPEDV